MVWKGSIEEREGIKIIKNPNKPIYDDEKVFSLEEELTIKEKEGLEKYVFSDLINITVDEAENIYVLDFKEANIKIFDKFGNYVGTIGKRGQGPGELNRPIDISTAIKKEIIVLDGLNRRISFFTLEGNFIKDISAKNMNLLGCNIDSSGNIFALVLELATGRPTYELKKFDENLENSKPLTSSPFQIRTPGHLNPYPLKPSWVLDNLGRVVYAYPDKYVIQVFNLDGKEIKNIIKDNIPVKIPQKEIDRLKESAKRYPDPVEIDVPKHFPPFYSFTVDDKGKIYVETYETNADRKTKYYDVFDFEGKYIAQIQLRTRPAAWKKNKLYTIEQDKNEHSVIKRYKVNWKY